MCVEFNEGPSLPSCLQLFLFSLSHLLGGLYFMSSVLLSPLLKSSISIICVFGSRALSLPSWYVPSECPPGFFTIEVGISIVKPCPGVPNSTLNFVY